MSFVQGLHGTIAIVLLCTLLFAEEAGVPIPFAPGEVTLIAGGLLIDAGGLDPWVFMPLAIIACLLGAVIGYSWARLVGQHGLLALADRLRARKHLDRVSDRVRAAGWRGVAVSRLIPGLRIYTTLAAGALGVSRRDFLIGATPVTIVWVVVFTLLGTVVGLPAAHFLGQFEKLAVQGLILIAIGVGGYVAVRRIPAAEQGALVRVPSLARIPVALAIDAGIVASIVAGVLSLGRRLLHIGANGWVDLLIVIAFILVGYLVATRRGTGATAGEALLRTSYHRRIPLVSAPPPPVPALKVSRATAMAATALLRRLADPVRCEIVLLLLDGERDAAALTAELGVPEAEVEYHLAQLVHAGVVAGSGSGTARCYRIADPGTRQLAQALMEQASRGVYTPGARPSAAARP